MILDKFKGVFPAFYACYDELGEVSEERTKGLANYLFAKGVNGLYVGAVLENVFIKTFRKEKLL
ncbi:dihydrodipicolinate synthase family protein [Bacillus sp. N9]